MACSFCATGTMGFMAQLSSVDILEQWVHANHVRKCTNLVFMGMGEPFDNYLALCTAIHQLHHVFQLGPKHICVSTVGVVPKMIQFTIDCPGVHLALSLHAPTQACREKLVPTAKNYPIDKLMLAVDQYLKLHDRIMIEYILIRDLNATSVCAHQLGHLLSERSVILNLIPYNPTLANDQYHAPTSEEILAFETILRETYNIRTTVRRTMGQDIDGACGQLVLKKTSCTSNPSTTPLSTSLVDIEDVGSTSCSSTSKTSSLALPLPSPRSKKYIRSTPPTLKSTPSPFTTTTSSTPSTSSWTRTLLGSKWLTWLLTVVVGWVLMDGLVYRWRWGWNEFSSST
ncbi:hypothetical protein HMI55_006579 [Coelomomyces lativittatus]|nr:hypothetical protein HMI55_006579 [Coelomomyces lativittatus]